MRKLLLLLGIICVFVLSGCGKSDGIEGTWVPKIHSDNMRIESIQFTKQNDFSYKGVVTYRDGKQVPLLLNMINNIMKWVKSLLMH